MSFRKKSFSKTNSAQEQMCYTLLVRNLNEDEEAMGKTNAKMLYWVSRSLS